MKKKVMFLLVFVVCLLFVGIQNTIDMRAAVPEDPEVHTEIMDVIILDPLGYVDSNIYATRDIASDEGLKKGYCYLVSGNGKSFRLLSSYTEVKGTDDAPYLVVYRDYYIDRNGEEVTISGEGYGESDTYGSVRCDLYLTRGGDGGYELASWY